MITINNYPPCHGHKGDLHTENNDEGGECPRSINKCLVSQSTIKQGARAFGYQYCTLTKVAIMSDYEKVDIINDLWPELHYCTGLT